MFFKINQKVKLHQSFIKLEIDPKILFIRIHTKVIEGYFTALQQWLQMFACHLVEYATASSNTSILLRCGLQLLEGLKKITDINTNMYDNGTLSIKLLSSRL